MISVAEAQARLLALAEPVGMERLPLLAAAGRWAAEAVPALRTQPVADLSAMDGYAIRHTELPGPWRVVGEAAAGGAALPALAPGEAARIFTGAPVPDGADTVMVQEEAARDGDMLRLDGEGPPRVGANIRRAGSDFAAGTSLIAAGERLNPARIGLAALGGHGDIAVRRRVRVAIVSTGDELVEPGSPGDAGLPNSNGPMLAALLDGWPVEIVDMRIVRDDLDALATAFAELAARADILVTIGGASVGDHDLVKPALAAAGAEIDFWRIAMRPGKPLLAGQIGTTVCLGLPGNPVSAFVTAMLFLLPLVARLGGAADPQPGLRTAILGGELPAGGPRAEYLRARFVDGRIEPILSRDSALLGILASADALIVRAAAAPPLRAGERVDYIAIA